jgi:hypothetical protein
MMRVGAEDGELWGSIGLLAASCGQGALYGGPHSSPLGGFGEVDIPGGTTG